MNFCLRCLATVTSLVNFFVHVSSLFLAKGTYVLLFFSWVTVNVLQHAVNYYRKYEIVFRLNAASAAALLHKSDTCLSCVHYM